MGEEKKTAQDSTEKSFNYDRKYLLIIQQDRWIQDKITVMNQRHVFLLPCGCLRVQKSHLPISHM